MDLGTTGTAYRCAIGIFLNGTRPKKNQIGSIKVPLSVFFLQLSEPLVVLSRRSCRLERDNCGSYANLSVPVKLAMTQN